MSVNGVLKRVHVLVFKLLVQDVEAGVCVLHRCDNPACVNPGHLFLGSRRDNNRDRAAKGRSRTPRGERHPLAKLTEQEVMEIRRLSKLGSKRAHLGAQFGVNEANIRAICKGRSWTHLPL